MTGGMVAGSSLPSHSVPGDVLVDEALLKCAQQAAYGGAPTLLDQSFDETILAHVPVLFQVSSTERLLDDSVVAAKQVRHATLDIIEDLPHVPTLWSEFCPEASDAFNRLAEFLIKHLSQ